MNRTRNSIPQPSREKVAQILNARLADATDLRSQAKQAHWNLRSPQFIALHELFDETAAVIVPHIDAVAERATALGGVAEGDLRTVVKRSRLPAFPTGISAGPDHVNALATSVAAAGKHARAAIAMAMDAGDNDTADLFTDISRDLDQRLWFLEAHTQANA